MSGKKPSAPAIPLNIKVEAVDDEGGAEFPGKPTMQNASMAVQSSTKQNHQAWMFEDEDGFEDPFPVSEGEKRRRMLQTMSNEAYIESPNPPKKYDTPKTSLTNSTLTPTSSDWEIHPRDENSLPTNSTAISSTAGPPPPVASIRVSSPLPVMPGKKGPSDPKSKMSHHQTADNEGNPHRSRRTKNAVTAVAAGMVIPPNMSSPLKSDMLENFLKVNGQDEKLASEMAVAFEAFLLQQNQNRDEVSDLGLTATTPHAVSEIDPNNASDAVSELAFTSVSDWAPPPPQRPPMMVHHAPHHPPHHHPNYPPPHPNYPPPPQQYPPHPHHYQGPPVPHNPPPPTPTPKQKTTSSQGSDYEEDEEDIEMSERDSVSFENFYNHRTYRPVTPHYPAPPPHPHHPPHHHHHYPPPPPHGYPYPPPPPHYNGSQGRYDDYDYAGTAPSPRHSTGSYYNDYEYGRGPPPPPNYAFSPSPSPVPRGDDYLTATRHSNASSGRHTPVHPHYLYPGYAEPPPTPGRGGKRAGGSSTKSHGSNGSPLRSPYPPNNPQHPSSIPSGRRSTQPPGVHSAATSQGTNPTAATSPSGPSNAGIPQPHQMMQNMARSLRSASNNSGSDSWKTNPWGGSSPLPAVPTERPIEEQMKSLSITERNCVQQLKQKWESRKSRTPLSTDLYLRMARNSPGKPFVFHAAWKVMKKMDSRYFTLSITQLEEQINKRILFPAPGLQDKQGHDSEFLDSCICVCVCSVCVFLSLCLTCFLLFLQVFYMRPSRFIPKTMSINYLMDNLVYVMNCLNEKERNCKNGIGLVANMTDWKMINFSVSYWHRFMATLQGRKSPTRIKLFLLVNPPSWFNKIWLVMKPMMSDDFRKRVHMISFHALKYHLKKGYEVALPDDIHSGRADTDAIIKSFIEERKKVESTRILSA